jgi:CopG family nickel-responsive transcriptional regulator
MPGKMRISISIPQELAREFDSMSKSLGHSDRSKAVSEAMREFISGRKWDLGVKGEVPGVLLLTYDHHANGLNRALTEVQHEYPDVITATMHIHLSKHTCLEVIAFKGKGERVRGLAKMLHSQRGVIDLKLVSALV